jgi:hypothetical protein
MKRRQLIGYAGAGLLTAVGTAFASEFIAHSAPPSSSVSIQWLGHTCFLFTDARGKILVNPFRTLGCTAKYRPPNVAADLVLISSQLLDEGAVEGLPGERRLIYEPVFTSSTECSYRELLQTRSPRWKAVWNQCDLALVSSGN